MTRRYVTNRQVYDAIQSFIAQHGYCPTVREIAEIVGINVSSTWAHLRTLRKHGWIVWNDRQIRTIRIIAEWPSESGAA